MRSIGIELEGDSVSSLKWAERDRTSSIIARRSNIGYTLVTLMNNITIKVTTHVPGVENWVWDGLTRSKTAVEVGLPPEKQFSFPLTIQSCNSLHTATQLSHSTHIVNMTASPMLS
jgi:hypothetical protein